MNLYDVLAGQCQTNYERLFSKYLISDIKTLVGILPLNFRSNGNSLIDYAIYGNFGGVGDKTENLFNKESAPSVTSGYLSELGEIVTNSAFNVSEYLPVLSGTHYVLSNVNGTSTNPAVCFYDINKRYISGIKYNKASSLSVITPAETAFLRMSYNKSLSSTAMLTVGTDLPSEYIPYGYKITIVCGDNTINIYIDNPIYNDETLTFEQTAVSIPTNKGMNTLTVETNVQPEKMYIKYTV